MALDRTALFALATSEPLERAVKRVPGGESTAWRAASRYFAGRSRTDALATAAQLFNGAMGRASISSASGCAIPRGRRVVEEYVELANALPAPPADVWLSVELSHLALDVDPRRPPAAGGDRRGVAPGVGSNRRRRGGTHR